MLCAPGDERRSTESIDVRLIADEVFAVGDSRLSRKSRDGFMVGFSGTYTCVVGLSVEVVG